MQRVESACRGWHQHAEDGISLQRVESACRGWNQPAEDGISLLSPLCCRHKVGRPSFVRCPSSSDSTPVQRRCVQSCIISTVTVCPRNGGEMGVGTVGCILATLSQLSAETQYKNVLVRFLQKPLLHQHPVLSHQPWCRWVMGEEHRVRRHSNRADHTRALTFRRCSLRHVEKR